MNKNSYISTKATSNQRMKLIAFIGLISISLFSVGMVHATDNYASFNNNLNEDLFPSPRDLAVTNVPTASSTAKNFTIPIDLYLLIDSSGSIGEQSSKLACKASTKDVYPPDGKNCWELFTIFAMALFDIVKELAGGYAPSGIDGGIRLSLYTFACKKGDPITRSVLVGPSGDPVAISKGFDFLSKIVPADGTCPSEGLRYIRKEIENTIAQSYQRISGVVLITDGMIDSENSERIKARTEANNIVGQPGTNFFAVSVSNDPASQKQQTLQLLSLAGGDDSKIFPIENQGSLPTIQSVLAAALGNDFFATFDLSNKVAEAVPYGGNGVNQVCSGTPTNVVLSGRSVQYLSRNVIVCSFSRPDVPSSLPLYERNVTVTSTVDPVTKTRICELPGSFMSNVGDNIKLQLKVPDGSQYRAIGKTLSLSLRMVDCAKRAKSLINPSDRCLIGGGNTIVSFSGPSVKYARSRLTQYPSSTYGPICVFTQSGVKLTSLATASAQNSDDLVCSLDPSKALDKILAAKVSLAPVDSVSIGVGSLTWETVNGEADPYDSMPIGLVKTDYIDYDKDEAYPNAVKNGCVSFSGLSSLSTCWTGLSDPANGPFVYLTGKSIKSLTDKKSAFIDAGFALECGFSRSDDSTQSVYFSSGVLVNRTVNGISEPDAQCSIPSQILQTNDANEVTRNFVVGLYASNKEVDDDDEPQRFLLTNNDVSGFQASVKVKSCFVITYQQRKCLGEDHQFSITGEGISRQLGGGVTCRFLDTVNEVSVNVDAITVNDNAITCKDPSSSSENIGLFFNALDLIEKGTGRTFFNVKDVSFGLDLCLNFTLKNMPTDNSFCWGSLIGDEISQSPTIAATLSVTGTSTRFLSPSLNNIQFAFVDGITKQDIIAKPSKFAKSVTANDGSGEFSVSLPSAALKRLVGVQKILAKFVIGTRTQASYSFDIKVSGCAKLEEKYISSTPNEVPTIGFEGCWPFCCMRDSVNILITGESVNQAIIDDDARCLFFSPNDAVVPTTSSALVKVGDKTATCSAPGWAPFSLREYGIYNKVVVSVAPSKKGQEIATLGLIAPDSLCSSTDYQKTAVFGEPITVSMKGTSLSALNKWRGDASKSWNDIIDCSLIDTSSKRVIRQGLSVSWNSDISVLSCKRPGTFDASDLSTTAIRVTLEKPDSSRLLSSSSVSSQGNSIVLVDDMVLDVTIINPFSIQSANVICTSPGSNTASISVSGAKYATSDLGKFACNFISDDGFETIQATNTSISDDGLMTCSLPTPGYTRIVKYTVGFDSKSKGIIPISSGSLDISKSCFPVSSAPSFSPSHKPTKNPTIPVPTKVPTTSKPSVSPTIAPSKSPVTPIPTRSPTNATDAPVPILGGGVTDVTQSPTQKDEVFGLFAIIGVAVGGFLFLLLLVLLLVLRRRRNERLRKQREKANQNNSKNANGDVPIIIIGANNDDNESTSSADHQYNIGDRVEVNTGSDANNNGDETWLKGTISGIEPDMNEKGKLRFTVTYDKDMNRSEPEKDLLSTQLRPMRSDYRVGDIVDAYSAVTKRWEKASIAEVKPNDKYTVTFSSSLSQQQHTSATRRTEEDVIGQTQIRPYNPQYEIGDVVEGDFNGNWKRGVVKNVIGNEHFDVQFDEENDTNTNPEIMERGESNILEMPANKLRKLVFNVGDKIDILKGTTWLEGEVKKVQKNGKYEISVLPGTAQASTEGNVPVIRLRRRKTVFRRNVGDIVEVHQPSNDTWRRARITDVVGTDSYNVEYDDGKVGTIPETEKAVPEVRLRTPTYKIGDVVEAKTKDGWFAKGSWNRAKVVGVNKQDGTYDVAFMDESLGNLKNLQQDHIRNARSEFNVGDQVEFFDKNNWNDGVISKVLADNNYMVKNSATKEEKLINGDLIRWPKYEVGDSVRVKVMMEKKKKNGKFEWEPAELTSVDNDAKTVDVKFEDCTTEQDVPFSRIKKYASIGETNRAIQDAMNAGFRPPLREHEGGDGPGAIDKSLRYQKKAPLSAKILMGNKFSVTVNKEFGLGLTLGWTREGEVVVNNFKDLNNGDWGPLEACGLVGLRDQVVAINGQNVEGHSFADVAEIIRASPNIITFVFRRATPDKLSVALQ